MLFIRQGSTHKVVLGPAVAVGDGFTPVTSLSLSGADEAEVILHDNGTVVDISGYTWAAITTADGYYHLTLQSGISGTVGHVTVVVNDDSLCLPLRQDFTVVEEAVYDALFAASAAGYQVPIWASASSTVSLTNTTIAVVTLTNTATTLTNLPAITTNWLTATGINANAFTAAKFDPDVTTELQAGLATASALATVQTSVDDIPTSAELATALGTADDAVLAAVAGLNNLSSAQAQTAAAAALTAYDPPTNAEMEARTIAAADYATAAAVAAVQADLPQRITKNTALAGFPFFVVLTSDHVTGATGKTVTATRSLDGAAFGACANSVSEIANGWYKIDLAAGDLNGNTVALKFTATDCDARMITLITQPT